VEAGQQADKGALPLNPPIASSLPQQSMQTPSKAVPPQQPPLSKNKVVHAEQSIKIRPNLGLSLLYQAFVFAILIGVAMFALWFVKVMLDVDIIGVVLKATSEISSSSSLIDDASYVAALVIKLQEVMVLIIIQVVIALLLLQIPLLSKEWIIYKDKIAVKKGFFGKKSYILLANVISVSYKSYLPGLDFGKLTIDHTGGEGRLVELPFVLWARQVCGLLYDEVAKQRVIRDQERIRLEAALRQQSAKSPEFPQPSISQESK